MNTQGTLQYNTSTPPEVKAKHIMMLALLVIVGIVIWYYGKKRLEETVLTPTQVLQALRDTSVPVNTTPEERVADLRALTAQSDPVEISVEDRIRELNELENI